MGLESFLLARGGGHGGGRIFVANHFSNFHQIYLFIGQNWPIKSGPWGNFIGQKGSCWKVEIRGWDLKILENQNIFDLCFIKNQKSK